jgi:hypothetical protein
MIYLANSGIFLQSLGHFSTAGQSSADLVLTVKARPGEFPSSEEIDRQNAHRMLDRTSLEDANMESNGNHEYLGGSRQHSAVNPKCNVTNHSHHLLVFTPGCVVL